MVNKLSYVFRGHPRTRRDPVGGNAVVEIHQHFAQIEYDCFREHLIFLQSGPQDGLQLKLTMTLPLPFARGEGRGEGLAM